MEDRWGSRMGLGAELTSTPPLPWGRLGAISGYRHVEMRELDEWRKTFMFSGNMMVPLTKTE